LQILHDSELLNRVSIFFELKGRSIICQIVFLIRHVSRCYRIGNLFLDNLGRTRYGISLSHDIGNFVERRNYTLVILIISKYWEILTNIHQVFRFHITYIQRMGKY